MKTKLAQMKTKLLRIDPIVYDRFFKFKMRTRFSATAIASALIEKYLDENEGKTPSITLKLQ